MLRAAVVAAAAVALFEPATAGMPEAFTTAYLAAAIAAALGLAVTSK